MAEIFSGNLLWITMGGRLDVKHPDGRVIRTSWARDGLYTKACALGKNAIVDVKIHDDIPGAGATWPTVLDVRASQSSEERT